MDEYIELTNDEGNKQKFEILDVITKDEEEYVILLPEDSEEVIILKVITSYDNEEEIEYVEVEDEKLADEIFEEFLKRNE